MLELYPLVIFRESDDPLCGWGPFAKDLRRPAHHRGIFLTVLGRACRPAARSVGGSTSGSPLDAALRPAGRLEYNPLVAVPHDGLASAARNLVPGGFI
jgi:hypothetical protein